MSEINATALRSVDAEAAECLLGVLVDVAQLLDGWHQDGTAWSDWDESVRRRVGRLLLHLYSARDAKV